MRRLRVWATVCTILLVLAHGARAADCNNPKKIEDLRDCWQQSWNQKELDKVVSLYSPDAALLTGDGRFDGRDNIKAYLKTKLDSANSTFAFSTLEHVEPNNYGYDSGTFQMTITQTPGGATQQQVGSYLFVAQKDKNGRLLIVQHAFVTKKSGTPTAPCPWCILS